MTHFTTRLVSHDFFGDGSEDILWRNQSGQVAIWDMNGTALASGSLVTDQAGATVSPGAGWTVAGTGAFNSDLLSDIVLRGTDGSVATWFMSGARLLSGAIVTFPNGAIANPGPSWTFSGTGDFYNEGQNSDILWRGADGSVAIWNMNGSVHVGNVVTQLDGALANPGASWTIAGRGDFYADGRSDILWRGADGLVVIWNMNGATLSSSAAVTDQIGAVANPGAFWTIAGTGDFDAEGRSDILWRGADGSVAVWDMTGSVHAGRFVTLPGGTSVNPGLFWTVAGTGDLNGDSRTDIIWRGQDGSVAAWLMDGSTLIGGGFIASLGGGWELIP